jgi:hypothetical protein
MTIYGGLTGVVTRAKIAAYSTLTLMTVPNTAPGVVTPPSTQKRLRLIRIATLALLVLAFVGSFYLFFDPVRRAQLEVLVSSPIGLVVLFFISLISNAT